MAASRSKKMALGGGGGGGSSGGPEKKQLITIRLLTRPPPPCGNFVKILRKTATAEATRPAKIMIAGVLFVGAGVVGIVEFTGIAGLLRCCRC